MPTYDSERGLWIAKRKRNGQSYHLGYWKDKDRAIEVEAIFDRQNPKLKHGNETRRARKAAGGKY